MCPQCSSFELKTLVGFDCGRDSETEYQDAEERYECRACGAVAEADEILRALAAAAELRKPVGSATAMVDAISRKIG